MPMYVGHQSLPSHAKHRGRGQVKTAFVFRRNPVALQGEGELQLAASMALPVS